MEHTREFKVTIYEDTNKCTSVEVCATAMQAVVALLPRLSDEQRMEAFSEYCRYCGTDNPRCQCWNDE